MKTASSFGSIRKTLLLSGLLLVGWNPYLVAQDLSQNLSCKRNDYSVSNSVNYPQVFNVSVTVLTDAKTPVNSYSITLAHNDTNPANTNNVQSFSFNVLAGGTVTPGTSVPQSMGQTNSSTPQSSYSTVIGSYAFAGNNFPLWLPGPPYVNYRFPDVTNYYLFTTTYDASKVNVTINSQFSWDTQWGAYGAAPYTKNCTHADSPLFGNVTFDMRGGIKKAESPPDCGGGCSSCSGGNKAMAGAALEKFQAGITITDTPVSYTPGVGPAMNFTVRYRQRQTNQPTTLNFSNLGAQWNGNWISYIGDGPTNGAINATYHSPNGGIYPYGNYQPVIGIGATVPNQGDFLANEGWTHATLHYRQGPERYERWMPDGTVEKYACAVGTSPNRFYFLTSITDPQGNVTTLTYDSAKAQSGNAVLNSVTDPTGGQLTFSYNASTSYPFLISKVTRSNDGLSAKFQYTNGQLTSISDTIGLTSSFHYAAGTSFIDSMTTAYGKTTFNSSDGPGYLEADMTNPLNQTERVEYQEALSSSLFPTPIGAVPPAPNGGLIPYDNLQTGNTFYWTRRAMADSGGSPDTGAGYKLAQVTHWAQSGVGSIGIPLSTEMPLEGRIWYNYPSQPSADTVNVTASGGTNSPSLTARLLDNNTTQYSTASYTATGLIATSSDPLGRTTNYSYDHNNNIDLLQVAQTNPASSTGFDVLSTMTYNQSPTLPLHVPVTVTDAAGQVTTLTYFTNGLLHTRTVVVGGLNQMTTLTYWPTSWYLKQVTGPIAGATTSYSYDGSGRVQTVTDSEGYMVTSAYDNLDRPTSTTYPDGTSNQTFYKILDVDHTIDRQGRIAKNTYDAIRELLSTSDPLGSITKYSWCTCGGLATLTDANNNVTTWGLDLQGRVTSKTYADSSAINYVYETNMSRLHTMTDAKGNGTTYSYNVDSTLLGTSYSITINTDAQHLTTATPNVSFTYDPVYKRVLTMADGSGTTTYSYNSVNGAIGAGRLASVIAPIYGTASTAAITYGYDELGRVTSRSIDGANPVGTTYDALGRVTNVTNALAPASTTTGFVYTYLDQTSRLLTVTDPVGTGGTGQSLNTTYSYFGNTGDQRLQEIKNLSGTTPLSDYQYTYNPVGTIATWQQQTDSTTPNVYTLTYDNSDELTNAVLSNTSTHAWIATNAYNYDPVGNRLVQKFFGGGITAMPFNNLNQLTGETSSSTSTTVAGHASASISSVTIDGGSATISSSTNFTANVSLPAGTNVVSVVAQPSGTGSVTSPQRYQIVTAGTLPTLLIYDLNGNCVQDEHGNILQWDALNRLTKITYHSSGDSSLFAYDGLSRRVQIVEKNASATVTSTKNDLWIGSEIAEERNSGNAVTKRFFAQGEQQTGTNYYYTRDHLRSVREVCNSSGGIVARYSYDPYGRTTLVSGSNLATFQYTGDYAHLPSGLNLTKYRAYDSNTGRWLSRDPIAEAGGMNLYGYCANDPTDSTDPLGLKMGHADYVLVAEFEVGCPCKAKGCKYRLLGIGNKPVPPDYPLGDLMGPPDLNVPGTCGKPCPKTQQADFPIIEQFRVNPPSNWGIDGARG